MIIYMGRTITWRLLCNSVLQGILAQNAFFRVFGGLLLQMAYISRFSWWVILIYEKAEICGLFGEKCGLFDTYTF